jgi:magnesium transporter
LQWPLGYPLAVLAMVVFSGVLYGIFKRRGWL